MQHQEVSLAGTTGTTGTTQNEVTCATPEDDVDYDERAALVEVGAGVPRRWAEGFARLDLSLPPSAFSPERWRQLIDDGGRFLDCWGSRAAELGWSPLDVFGVHPSAPVARHDAMGLASLIGGGEVVAITAVSATIRSHAGRELVYLRRAQDEAVALWELTGSTTA